MKKNKFFNSLPTASVLMLLAAMAMSGNARAQVTIGADLEPQPFSVLELVGNGTKGLRLPQVTADQRDALSLNSLQGEAAQKALGLQIFNTSTLCVETWNGVKWIEACAPLKFPESADINGTINITTFVNVMYDFQHQEMYVYDTGSPVSYQWFAKRLGQTDTEYKPIAIAKSAAYTIPADFVKNVFQPLVNDGDTDYNDSIMFACVAEYADGKFKTASMDILFIGTNTAGYGELNGVKYLTLQMGKDGTVKGGTMKVALLNLGQSADWTHEGGYIPNNDAGDLGDFYQWGRVADGHQNTVWKKGTDHRDSILPFGATPTNTSDTMSYKRNSYPAYNTDDHQVKTDNAHYGKFIKANAVNSSQGGDYDWYNTNNSTAAASHDNSLWGNSTLTTYAELTPLNFTWTYPSNNPCPSNWRIPSRYNIGNLYRGSDSPTTDSSKPYDANNVNNNNTWEWRDCNGTSSTVIGGVIITTNAFGKEEKLFLPASGERSYSSGALSNAGTRGYYLSSTYYNTSYTNTYTMYFNSSEVYAGNSSTYKARGFSARCVAEF
jgi:uncharacterized protein (TIGR02145 family)